jgi:hypothetical protein
MKIMVNKAIIVTFTRRFVVRYSLVLIMLQSAKALCQVRGQGADQLVVQLNIDW